MIRKAAMLARRAGHRGPRPWVEVLLGCGLVIVLVASSLAGGLWLVRRKGDAVMDRAWRDLRLTTERLHTAESTLALYRANPALAEIYPTEVVFQKTVEGWRPKLGQVPEQRPPLESLLRYPPMVQVHRNLSDGHETVRMKFKFASGAVLEMEMDQDKLTSLMLK